MSSEICEASRRIRSLPPSVEPTQEPDQILLKRTQIPAIKVEDAQDANTTPARPLIGQLPTDTDQSDTDNTDPTPEDQADDFLSIYDEDEVNMADQQNEVERLREQLRLAEARVQELEGSDDGRHTRGVSAVHSAFNPNSRFKATGIAARKSLEPYGDSQYSVNPAYDKA